MPFANPSAFLWALLAIPIIVLYLLKVRHQDIVVPTLQFWEELVEDQDLRAWRERLRHIASLLLQLAFLALLVASLAEPFLGGDVRGARRLVLVIDNSASMNTQDADGTRLQMALAEARRIVTGLHAPEQAAVISAGTQPKIRSGLTEYRRALQDAVDGISSTEGSTRITEAVALARRILAGAQHGRVVVLTDGCFDEMEELVNSEDVQLLVFGSRTSNVGITEFQARRSLRDPVSYEVLVEVSNCSDQSAEIQLRLDLNDEVMDVIPLELDANAVWKRVLEHTSVEGGRLVARLDPPDGCAIDNQAIALVPARKKLPVTLVTEGDRMSDWFLEKVFSSHPLVELTISADESSAVIPRPVGRGGERGAESNSTVNVFHREMPTTLPDGPAMVINPVRSWDLCEVGGQLPYPIVDKQDDDSPLMAHLNFRELRFPGARQLVPKANARMLATNITQDPLFCAIDREQGRVLVLNVNIGQTDLPMRTAFPILAANALSWLNGENDNWNQALRTGEVTRVHLGHSAQLAEVFLEGPGGRIGKLPVYRDQATVGPLAQCAVWTIHAGPIGGRTMAGESPSEAPLMEIACNLANREESDLRPRLEAAGHDDLLETAALPGIRPIWFYLIAVAMLLSMVEWHGYQRRWVG